MSSLRDAVGDARKEARCGRSQGNSKTGLHIFLKNHFLTIDIEKQVICLHLPLK